MTTWYNEIDPAAAVWLEELIHENLIAPGVVDRRSIKDVQPDDLRGFDQCHFFAGIGIWSHALRRAGWPDERPVWTGSCPCQPFSPAGKGLGFEDARHLWPDWFRLVAQCRPDQILGEQSAAAGAWVDLVRADLEGAGAAFAVVDIPAAGFAEGPHIRQRLYWVADFDDAERWADLAGGYFGDWPAPGRVEGHGEPRAGGAAGGLGHHHQGLPLRSRGPDSRGAVRVEEPAAGAASSLLGCDWLLCHDARIRPVEAGTFPLAPSDPVRVGLLRGYGNSLDAEAATAFVAAYLDAEMVS